jgi:hypothetical protein
MWMIYSFSAKDSALTGSVNDGTDQCYFLLITLK